jgi:hypothetical protein
MKNVLTGLVKYDVARRMLAEAKTIDEVKGIRDKADAMRLYAHQAMDRTMEVDAGEIRIRAERRLGEMITHSKAQKIISPGQPPANGSRARLSDAGIDRKLSMKAQRFAEIPNDRFEEGLAQWRDQAMRSNGRRLPADPTIKAPSRSKQPATLGVFQTTMIGDVPFGSITAPEMRWLIAFFDFLKSRMPAIHTDAISAAEMFTESTTALAVKHANCARDQ